MRVHGWQSLSAQCLTALKDSEGQGQPMGISGTSQGHLPDITSQASLTFTRTSGEVRDVFVTAQECLHKVKPLSASHPTNK